jgi:hypothetical protein
VTAGLLYARKADVLDIKERGGGGMAQAGDDATVARKLHDLLQELEGKSQTTFPGDQKCARSENEWTRRDYEDKCRFLALVRECAQMMWGEKDGRAVRYQRTWGQTARMMQDRMQEKLHAACALQSSKLWYCEDIHRIRRLVDGICLWQAVAVAKAGAAAAEAEAVAEARARAAAEAEAALAAVMRREVQAFESVTVVASRATPSAVIVLTAERREALREVVRQMRVNIFVLQSDVAGYNPDKKTLLTSVEAYHESCVGEKPQNFTMSRGASATCCPMRPEPSPPKWCSVT